MDIDTHIENLRHEVETAIRTFYAFDKVMQLMSEQYYVDLFNKNLYFWKITISALQTKMFIALGRLYDDSNDAFSFHSFMKICRENISEFNRDNFEKRRQKEFTERPDWLDDYLKDAYFADIDDIHELSKLAQPHNKRMKGLYKEIRSKVFAHAIHTDESVISNLFMGTKYEEIENALKALWSIYNQIWQMYHNAREPMFKIEDYPYKDEVHNCIKLAVTGRSNNIQ
jgi:hypothetical protein